MIGMYGNEEYKKMIDHILFKKYSTGDINHIETVTLKQLKKTHNILQNETPIWYESKGDKYMTPFKKETIRTTY